MKRLTPVLIALALFVSACGLLEPTPNPDIVEVQTLVAPTPTFEARPTTSPPTFVPVFTFTPDPSAASPVPTAALVKPKSSSGTIRIQFPRGGIAATVKGSVGESSTISYVLRALYNQRMTVQITSPDNLANFEVRGEVSTTPFKPMADDARAWTGILPSTQDYFIDVGSIAGPTDFELTVTIVSP